MVGPYSNYYQKIELRDHCRFSELVSSQQSVGPFHPRKRSTHICMYTQYVSFSLQPALYSIYVPNRFVQDFYLKNAPMPNHEVDFINRHEQPVSHGKIVNQLPGRW